MIEKSIGIQILEFIKLRITIVELRIRVQGQLLAPLGVVLDMDHTDGVTRPGLNHVSNR